MKQYTGFVFLAFICFTLASCGKSPVGPAMSSLSSGVYSTSSSSNTTSTSSATNSANGNGTTGVSNQEGTGVDSISADTGVSGVDGSTGVSGATFIPADQNNESGGAGYSNLTLVVNNTITHYAVLPTLSGSPIIGWNASGVNPAYQRVRIFVSKMSPTIEDTWDIRDIPRSKGSVRFGDSSAGNVVSPAKALTRGQYTIFIAVYDDNTNFNNTYGGGNFVVQ